MNLTRTGLTSRDLTMHAVAADSAATACGAATYSDAPLIGVRDHGSAPAVAVELNDLWLDGGRACAVCRARANVVALSVVFS